MITVDARVMTPPDSVLVKKSSFTCACEPQQQCYTRSSSRAEWSVEQQCALALGYASSTFSLPMTPDMAAAAARKARSRYA